MKIEPLYNFISPLTGRLRDICQFPDLQKDWGWVGDINNRPKPIDLSTYFKLPDLTKNHLWIGDNDNKAEIKSNIELNNLPDLGVATVEGLALPAGKIWRGTSLGRPEESNALSEAIADILALNARLLAGNFIMGSAPVKTLWPGAQFLSSIDNGMLKKTGSTLEHAVAGTDYVDLSTDPFDDERIALIRQTDKFIKRSTIRVLEGSRILDLTSLGVGTIQASNQITSDESIFATNDIGSREVKIYDYWNNEGRLTKSFNLKGPAQFLANINYIVPTTAGTTGQVLADIGQDVGSTYRKLGFVTAGANSVAKYIIQQPQEGLDNAQALSELVNAENIPVGGILKSAATTGVISIASGGKLPATDDYIRPIDLIEEIEGVLTEANTFASSAAAAAAASGAAAAAAALAAANAKLDFEMLPFLPIPLVTYGAQITAAIGVVGTAAASASALAASKLSSVYGTDNQIVVSGGDTIALADNVRLQGEYAVFPSIATLPENLIVGAIYFMEVVDDD